MLIYDCLVVIITAVEFIETPNPRGMHDTRNSKLQVAKQRVWCIYDLTIRSIAKKLIRLHHRGSL